MILLTIEGMVWYGTLHGTAPREEEQETGIVGEGGMGKGKRADINKNTKVAKDAAVTLRQSMRPFS